MEPTRMTAHEGLQGEIKTAPRDTLDRQAAAVGEAALTMSSLEDSSSMPKSLDLKGVPLIETTASYEARKPFYRKLGTAVAEKLERSLFPENMKQIWQRNLRLWELELQDQPTFKEEAAKWMDEIRDGDKAGNPGLKALRGDVEEKPHVSIVVPAHNEERYILQVLQSIAAQRYDQGVEVLIIDNNSDSTDRTAAFAEHCGARVIQYTTPDDSPDKKASQTALARQRGLEEATGGVVISTDGDAIVPHGWIAAMSDPLDRDTTIGAVTGGIVHYDRPDHYLVYGKDKASRELRRVMTYHVNKNGPTKTEKSSTNGANTAFRKADALRVHGYDIHKYPGEDTTLGSRLLRVGKIQYIDNEQSRVRVSPRRFEGIGRIGIAKALGDYRRVYRGKNGVIDKR